jgi:hypothetical protein
VEGASQISRFHVAPSFQLCGHQRSRGLTDGASLSGELDLIDAPIFAKPDMQMDFIAARRIISMHMHCAFRDLAVIARAFRVIEQHLLVEVFEFRVHAKKRCASARISIIASISSR